jgi:hypothetical protein
MLRHSAILFLVLAACTAGGDTDSLPGETAVVAGTADSAEFRADSASGARGETALASRPAGAANNTPGGSANGGATGPVTGLAPTDLPIVRGLYVNRWAAQSRRRMNNLIAMADTTEINAFVIDIKDEFGINYRSQDSVVMRNAGTAGAIPNLAGLLDTLKSRGILPIARIVVFKDSVAARMNPGSVIRQEDGSQWRDRSGLTWVSPYARDIWEYNIRIAEEVARMGFEEIQWDYIRFPEPYRSLPTQVFPGADGRGKLDALVEFLELARTRLHRAGVRSTSDVFGLVTTVPGTLEIGQKWEPFAQASDVLLPMVYPSHYPGGSFGVERPNADPYTIVYKAMARAHERNIAIGLRGETARAWLQAFTLGAPAYGAEELRQQKEAVYDAGFDGWILWHPGSLYAPFEAGLERELVSRKKPFPAAAVAGQTP